MFENKKILILGFARSGSETAKILINRNNKVILNDYENNLVKVGIKDLIPFACL